MRRVNRYLLLAAGLFTLTFALRASLPQVATGNWTSANNMSSLHDGGCSILLQDGRILVSGGSEASGPTPKIDIFNTDGTWSSAPPMLSPRAHQVCASLQSGQVLVAGGITTGGGATNSAEIFDPAANAWSELPAMTEARTNATASTLQDGRVLIAGGESSGGPSNSIEIFDPNSQTFSFGGTMSASRQNAAATVLQDGRVLIIGGSGLDANGNVTVLGSSDIYDPSNSTILPGPTLATARSKHSATTQLDGKVVVIGGNNGSNDLGSIEVFDPSAAGNFAPVSASLATERSGHLAFLLAKNNEVLVVGGQSAGVDLASAELYVPWGNQAGGTVQATGSMATARSQASGAPLSIVDGLLMVGGGSSQTSAELYSFATVKTDQSDYAPGTTVNITGTGWQPGETVTLTLVESPLIDTHPTLTAVADSNGNIFNNQFSPDSHDVNVRFYLTVTGLHSQAQNSFTDAGQPPSVSCAPNPVALNAATTCTASENKNQSGNSISWSLSPSGSGTFSPAACTLATNGNNASCSTQYNPTSLGNGVQAITANDTSQNTNGSINLTVYSNATHLAVTYPTSVTAGVAGNLLVTALDSNGKTAQGYTGTVSFSSSDPQAILPSPYTFTAADAGSHTFTATLQTAGTQSIAGSGTGGVGSATQNGILVSFAALSRFVFSTITTQQAGTPFNITISAEDAFGNTVTSFSGNGNKVTLTSTGNLVGAPVTTPAFTNGVLSNQSVTVSNAGSFTISATGTGGNSGIGGTSNSFTVNPSTVSTTTVISSSGNPSILGQGVTFTATVSPSSGTTAPTGTVQFAVDGVSFGSPVSLSPSGSNGVASSGTDSVLAVGAHTVSATYTPSTGSNFTSSNGSLSGGQTVNKADTLSAVTSSVNPSAFGQSVTFTATVTAVSPGAGTPSGSVTFKDGTTTLDTKPLSAGSATYSTSTLPVGAHSITAIYIGDNNFNATGVGSSTASTMNQTVGQANSSTVVASSLTPSTYGQAVTFTATVSANNGTPTGSVTFKDGSNSLGTGALNAGIATLNTSTLSAGSHTITAMYGGDTNFTGSTSAGIMQVVSKANPSITWANPADITYGTALSGTQLNATANVQGNFVYSPAAGTVLNAGAQQTLSLTFTPIDTTDYNTAPKSVMINVMKATASIVVNPYILTYDGSPHTATGSVAGVGGVLLNGLDLSGTTHTSAGSYTDTWIFTDATGNYSNASGTVNDVIGRATATILVTPYDVTYDGNSHSASGTATGVGGTDLSTELNLTGTAHTNAGTYPDSWTFTDSAGNYNPASGTVTDAIEKATPMVTWANPAAISYGSLLTSAQLNAKGSVPGTLSYNPPGGTILNVGTHQPLVVLLTPTDSTNYNTANATTYIDVTQVTPAISWPTPADITYGSALGSMQLDATSSALGMTGWWKAEGNATDSFAANNGVLLGGTTYTSGEDGQAFSFPDASGDGVTIPHNSGYDMDSPGFVASFWMKGTQSQTGQQGGLVTVLEKSHGWVDNTGWAFQASVSDGLIHFNVGQGGASPCCEQFADVPSTVNVLDGNWHFVVGTWDGQTTLSLYVDGTLQNTTSTATPANNTRAVNVGFSWGGGIPTRFFQGAIDEIKIFGNAPGKFAYTLADGTTPANGAVLNAGNGQTINLSFTPAEAINLASASGSVTINVLKANATINVVPYSVTYDGNSHSATGSATGVHGEALSGLDLSQTSHTNAGSYPDSWSFTDSTGNYSNATGSVNDSIAKANPTINVTSYSLTYDGNAHTATGTATGVKGEALAGLDLSATSHTNAANYTDGWTFTDSTGNYNNASGSVDNIITKATATIDVTPYSVTYDGNAHAATGTTIGVKGEALSGLDLTKTTHTNAGEYPSDAWTFSDSTGNYNNASGAVHDSIAKANATINITPYTLTYDGNAHTASGSIAGVKGEALTGLALGQTTHTNAGDYPNDAWTFTDSTGNYNNANGAVHDHIDKANVAINVIPYSVTYDGDSHTATGTVTGVKGEALSGLDLSGTTHSNAGTYGSDGWTFTDTTGNYNNANGTVGDAIARANPTVAVVPYSLTYDGNTHTATGTITGVKGEALSGMDLSGTTHNNAGDYINDPWTFTDSTGNYNNVSGTTHDQIAKANPTINVTGYNVTYDGNAHTATGSATGVKGEALSGLDLSSTTHTNAGSFIDKWSFTDATGNYNNASSSTADTIAQANAAITVTPYSVTYDGNAHSAASAATGVKGEALAGVDVSRTTHTNAGAYTDSWTFTDTTGNYNNATGSVSDAISKAAAKVTVSPYSITYDGNSHTAAGSALGVKNEALAGLDLTATTHNKAGDYPVDPWSFTDTSGNYINASGTVHDLIAKAKAVIAVSAYNLIFDGNPHTATGFATGVQGESLIGLNLSGTTHTTAGSYTDTWMFTDGTGNYNSDSGSVNDVIGKATPIVNWSNPANIIYGTALGNTQLNAAATGVGGSVLPGTFTYSPGSGTVVAPGSQSLTVNFVPSDTTDYASPIVRTVTIRVLFAAGTTCTNGMASHVIQPPIATNGTTVVKKGSTVPTKFALCDVNGNSVGPNAAFPNQNVVASYNIVSILNGTLANVDETLTSTTPDTAFRWDPTNQQWIYNTATGSGTNLNSAPATYGFQITLIDGTNITFQYGLK